MGYGVGERCFSTVQEAAQAFCSSVAGATSAGVVSCTAAAPSGPSSVAWTLAVTSESGSATSQQVASLQPCEPYDASYWAPVLAAFFLALVTITAIRVAFVRTFGAGHPP